MNGSARAAEAVDSPRLEVEALSKRFDDRLAVDAVSFGVASGELFALLGPSGSGKTTLLRMLAGLERPDAGRIRIDGEEMTGLPAHRRPVNLMFQRYALFPHMSVYDNIAYGLKSAGMSRSAVQSRVARLLGLIRMQGYERRRPEQLSGGQQQRVALARALARGPRLLLLDEPLAALDRRLRESTALELKRLQRETATTFVLVTHDQDEAMTLASRVGVMFDGRIHQIAAPQDVYERPLDRAVAEFIGDANFLETRVIGARAGRLLLDAGALGQFAVAQGEAPLPPPGNAVTLGLRPERIAPAEAGSDNVLAVELEAVLYHGDASVYHLRAADDTRLLMRRANDGQGPHRAAGERLHVGFAAADAFLLGR